MLVLQFIGDSSAVLGEMDHDLLVQPDVHRCRVIEIAAEMQFCGELLAGREATVEADKLHQIDDGRAPIEVLFVARSKIVQHTRNIS